MRFFDISAEAEFEYFALSDTPLTQKVYIFNGGREAEGCLP
jgi:hypothetical protein